LPFRRFCCRLPFRRFRRFHCLGSAWLSSSVSAFTGRNQRKGLKSRDPHVGRGYRKFICTQQDRHSSQIFVV
jgi:hypothetical protein